MTRVDLGAGVHCDLEKLIDSRLLVQANSGGGKSWCLRRLLEQTHGKVQQLIIDPEGEFATLREQFDYVLAARQHGDTIADPRSAKLLAERLLQLGVSAILDIYELKAHERIKFVRLFLEALVDAPKNLWHPALIIVDEAHVFCPQAGEAESAGAVIDLATRGRKRGFCAVLATQRLSKLHKDAAAECNNKLIGRTGLDVDVKRAADELGFPKERWREMRELEPGQFFCFGPAVSREVRCVHVGPIRTSHPKAGSRIAFTPPPPTDKVKKLLPQLSDLPKEAEDRQRSVDELRKENAVLKRSLTLAQREGTVRIQEKTVEKRVEVAVLKEGQLKRLEGVVERVGVAGSDLVTFGREFAATVAKFNGSGPRPTVAPRPAVQAAISRADPPAPKPRTPVEPTGDLTEPQRAILDVVAMLNVRGITPTRDTVARWLGIHPNGGRYGTNLGQLRAEGYLDGFQLTTQGEVAAGQLATGFDALLTALDDEPKRTILRTLHEAGGPLSRDELASALGIHPNGGRYGTNLAWLRTMGVITERGPIAVTEGAYQ